jgi:hypothetical protein
MARIGVIVAVLALLACGSRPTLRERVAGVQLDIPKQWSVHRLGTYCRGRVGPGLLITNIKDFPKHPANPGECTNAWDTSKLPSNYVLIDISRFNRRPAFVLAQHPSLPIRDSDLRRTAFPRLRALDFWKGDRQFNVRVWTGDKTSRADRNRLAALIESVRSDG